MHYMDGFGFDRYNDRQHQGHEGNNIFVARDTPIALVENCKVLKIGWNGLGGWGVLRQSNDRAKTYYCEHLEDYDERLQKYKYYSVRVYDNILDIGVEAGEIIGFTGS